jgi:hypothetical protein
MKKPRSLKASNKLEVRNYQDLLDPFEKQNYTAVAWQACIREVHRVYLTVPGNRWGSKTTKEITVGNKKRLFFSGLGPIILPFT